MSLTIDIDGAGEYIARMAKGETVVKEEMLKGIDLLTFAGEALSKKNVGVDTRHLQRSITQKKATFAGGVASGAWGTNVPYARPHETGRSAGKQPPISAMQAWAGRHGVNAYLVARAIGRKGTKGKWYMRDAKNEIEPKVQDQFRKVALRIIARMGGG